jgi:hypothetical protein
MFIGSTAPNREPRSGHKVIRAVRGGKPSGMPIDVLTGLSMARDAKAASTRWRRAGSSSPTTSATSSGGSPQARAASETSPAASAMSRPEGHEKNSGSRWSLLVCRHCHRRYGIAWSIAKSRYGKIWSPMRPASGSIPAQRDRARTNPHRTDRGGAATEDFAGVDLQALALARAQELGKHLIEPRRCGLSQRISAAVHRHDMAIVGRRSRRTSRRRRQRHARLHGIGLGSRGPAWPAARWACLDNAIE